MYIWLGEGTSLNAVCTAKERIAYLKDRSEEITQNVAQRESKMRRGHVWGAPIFPIWSEEK